MTNDPFQPSKARKRTTMADIKAKTDAPSENFAPGKISSMTFNMPEEWHKSFKMAALVRGITMKELLEEIFADYQKRQR